MAPSATLPTRGAAAAEFIVAVVDGDPGQPALEAGALAVTGQRGEGFDKSLLGDVFDRLGAAEEFARDGENTATVARDDLLEGVVIAREDALDQGVVKILARCFVWQYSLRRGRKSR